MTDPLSIQGLKNTPFAWAYEHPVLCMHVTDVTIIVVLVLALTLAVTWGSCWFLWRRKRIA